MRRLPFCTLAARERLAAASHSLPSSPNERNGGDTIAIYHCSIKIVSRGKGKSAVAAAAYRSGEKLTNEWDGLTHDYTKKGGVVHSEILLPAHAPPAFSDRSTLWNSVELSEKSNNAQLAREVEIALPVELSREEQTRLVREYCSSQFVSKGMIADFNLHDTGGGNPHAHIPVSYTHLQAGKEDGGAGPLKLSSLAIIKVRAAKLYKECDSEDHIQRREHHPVSYTHLCRR